MSVDTLERVGMTEHTAGVDEVERDALLLAADFRNGDERALERIYREHSSLVYSYCRRTLGEHRAADATQEVFLAAWRSRERYRPEAGSLAGWLMGIARFKVIDAYRAAQRNPADPAGDRHEELGADAEELDHIAQRMVVAEALLTLPERSRELVRMAFFDDRTHREIAEISGIPLGTVKSDIRRGLQRLQRHLEAFDDAPRS